MWLHESWGCFPFMWIFPLIFLVLLLLFLFRGGQWPMCGWRGMHEKKESAKEILDRRYASGEINREEYLRMKQELGQDS
ncbi:MAG: SHOCT domain-containing protein [Alphaproteobacteria bacterium]|nr:SHOCT domain-containing protein [Alphaproteobacteria bacterium]